MLSSGNLLDLLRENGGHYLSGEELSERLGVSRTAIWKHMHQLEAAGYQIEAVSHRGYRLVSAPDRMLPDEIRFGLATRRFGQVCYAFQETTSTNDRALELAAQGAAEGTLIAAEAQSRGRGRRERVWLSPAGENLLFSIIFRPPWIAEQAPVLTLLLAVAVSRSIQRETGLTARIKWPNDIFVHGAKVAGILTEMRAQADAIAFAVCGVGINVNEAPPGPLRSPAASLSQHQGCRIRRLPLLHRILQETETLYENALSHGSGAILDAYRLLTDISGMLVTVTLASGETLEGTVMGVDPAGALLLRLDAGVIRRLTSGEISVIPGARNEKNTPVKGVPVRHG